MDDFQTPSSTLQPALLRFLLSEAQHVLLATGYPADPGNSAYQYPADPGNSAYRYPADPGNSATGYLADPGNLAHRITIEN